MTAAERASPSKEIVDQWFGTHEANESRIPFFHITKNHTIVT